MKTRWTILILALVLFLGLLPAAGMAEGAPLPEAGPHTVTVEYKMPEGREKDAPDPQSQTGLQGTVYSMESPEVEGLIPDQSVVAGEFGDKDETFTVTYKPKTYVVRVEYTVPEGYKAPGRRLKSGLPGSQYSFESPEIAGLTPDKEMIKGVIGTSDENFTVTYTEDKFAVTVKYKVPEGYTAPPDGRAVGAPGTKFSIATPEIDGLETERTKVEGTFGKKDDTYTVSYTEAPHTVTVQYSVPAGFESKKPQDRSVTDEPGRAYRFYSPVIDGLTPDMSVVSGNIGRADETIQVTYSEAQYTVFVRYEVPAGMTPPKQQMKTGKTGTAYSFTSPTLDGLTPNETVLEGTIGDQNEVFVVFYTEQTWTLTVNYEVPEGYGCLDPAIQYNMKNKATYSVLSPAIDGLRPDPAVVEGTIEGADKTVRVTYAIIEHTVTVEYKVPDNYSIPRAQTLTSPEGTEYSFTSPEVAGLKPDRETVSGKIGTADETITVTYSLAPDDFYTCPRCGATRGYEHGLHCDTRTQFSPTYECYTCVLCWDCDYREVVATSYSWSSSSTWWEHSCSYSLVNWTPVGGGRLCISEHCPGTNPGGDLVCGNVGAGYHLDNNYGTIVTAGATAQITVGNETWSCNIPASGKTISGETFSAGDSIRVCEHCGTPLGLAKRATYTTTINFTVPAGFTAPETRTETGTPGTAYGFYPPEIHGLAAEVNFVFGRIGNADETRTVNYVPTEYHDITVTYVVPEGFDAPAPEKETGVRKGKLYYFLPPTLRNLKPDKAEVEGKMGTEDVNVTVTYEEVHTLTVHYKFPEGYTRAANYDAVYLFKTGEGIKVTSPEYGNVGPDIPVVKGVMGQEDLEETVTYDYNTFADVTHKLTVTYTVPEGFTAPSKHTESVAEGAAYSVASPQVEGLKPSMATVTGTMGRADAEVTVNYWKATHILTINYNVPKGYTRPDSWTAELKEGDEYVVRSPKVDGLSASPSGVGGRMGDKDETIEVTYTENPVMMESHNVTVTYTVPEAFTAVKPKTYKSRVEEGMKYSVASPAIEGLVPSLEKVEGTMGSEDVAYEVTYRAAGDEYFYVTVHAKVPEGYNAPKDGVMTGVPGTPFKFVAPVVLDLVPDKPVIEGKVTNADQEFTITYYKAYAVEVEYDVPEGYTAPSTIAYHAVSGYHYRHESPEITGLIVAKGQEVIEGDVKDGDVRITVVYLQACTLKIEYIWPDDLGEPQPEDWPEPYVATLPWGASYEVPSPTYEGGRRVIPTKDVVKGVIGWEENYFYTVVSYLYKTHKLRILYNYPKDYDDDNLMPRKTKSHFRYWASGGALSDRGVDMKDGETYEVASPEIKGLKADKTVIKGKMGNEDIEEVVTYTYDSEPHTLTVNYVFPENWTGERVETHTEQLYYGQTYYVETPEIEGLEHDTKGIEGTMFDEDITETVKYASEFRVLRVEFEYPEFFHLMAMNTYFTEVPISCYASFDELYAPGEHYHIDAPENTKDMEGMTVTPAYYDGVMGDEDMIVTFVYDYPVPTLTINFEFPSDYIGKKPVGYSKQVVPGQWYHEKAPNLPGLEPNFVDQHYEHKWNCYEANGVMSPKDLTITFVYTWSNDPHEVLEGGGQTVLDRKDGASFHIKGDHKDFTGQVEGDGKALERGKDYTDREGSTIIELTEDYLNTLEPGEHTLTIYFADGSVETTFQLLMGDINEDGVVDGRDVIRFMKYLSDEIDPETGEVIRINLNLADMNGDGDVDGIDMLRLVKVLGGQ